jgi:hypothetical protein
VTPISNWTSRWPERFAAELRLTASVRQGTALILLLSLLVGVVTLLGDNLQPCAG